MDEVFKNIMGREIDLLINYLKTRDPLKRALEDGTGSKNSEKIW